ncbi:AI-2E family transporter [Anianabacter salinae]|uniref:AI-2E family transporter n=1 Tax=Anianabacter salinae TaxID=2851023 RepID=UPI00225E0361|nr:AI-2E family transporter [Anianabacter salinae]MBV0913915.1 AI-2E family transporter [Anianabacter salinae]
MALAIKTQMYVWGAFGALSFVLLWLLGDVLLPFVLGGAVAYCLDPIADALERLGLSRVLATVVITLFAILIFVVLALAVVPTLIQQSVQLFNTAPELARNLQNFLTERVPMIMDEGSIVRQSLQSVADTIKSQGAELLNSVLTSALSLLNVVLLFFIVPVVAFYLLMDWDRMVGRIDELLPRDHAPTIRRLAKDVDRTLASFIRGQGTVMTILGVYYAGALMLAGLQFGLVIGAVAGLVSFIPYVGAILGGGLAIGIALFQFWGDWVMIGIIGAIFFSGQILEGNILTPKLVGSSVGLHPVWLLLALSVFGSVFGFIGLLVAVPVAAALGVFARFAVEQYKTGRLYHGLSWRDGPGD